MVPAGIVYRAGDGFPDMQGGTVETPCGGCAVGAAGGRGIRDGACPYGTAAVYYTGAARTGVLLSGFPPQGTGCRRTWKRVDRTGSAGRNGMGRIWGHAYGHGGAEGEREPAAVCVAGAGGKLAGAVPERMDGRTEDGGAEKGALHVGQELDVHLCRALAAVVTDVQPVWGVSLRGVADGAAVGGAGTGIAADGLYPG